MAIGRMLESEVKAKMVMEISAMGMVIQQDQDTTTTMKLVPPKKAE